jgi:beta-lactamase class D
MRLKSAFLPALILLAALGCAKTTGVDAAGANAAASLGDDGARETSNARAQSNVRAQTGSAREAARLDLAAYFKDFPVGAFVLYDLKQNRSVRYNEARCRERFSPFSTFKIPNSLIGLESGVIRDAEFRIKWDARKYPAHDQDAPPFNTWWQDQTLRTAVRRSVVWYFRELATQVGARRMKEYVRLLHYGNEDTSGPINDFWLGSSLKISPDEQIEFLKSFYKEELPFSKRSISIVKDIITLEETPDYKLSGKTGGGALAEGRFLGWFVGYVETKGDTYFFATQIEGPTYASIRDERINITKRILTDLGYMKH